MEANKFRNRCYSSEGKQSIFKDNLGAKKNLYLDGGKVMYIF
jgi:hypothetical protein